MKPRLSYSEHIERRLSGRQDSMEKPIILVKIEGSRERGGPNQRRNGFIKEVEGLAFKDLMRAIHDMAFWRPLNYCIESP